MIRRWPLVGRSEELQLIADATRPGNDRALGIVLSGSAGVGKTRLAREAVEACSPRRAHRHWIVGTASARSVPLGAFADIASDFGPDPLRRVREVIDGLIGPAGDAAVVVGVDDAHLLDDLSAFAIHQLVTRQLASVILTIRSGEAAPDAITAIWKDHHLERLELQPLSLEETTQLIEQVLDGPVQSLSARRFWQLTQGNALYLRHLVEAEVHAGRMVRHSGVWLWGGHPALSPTLAEILEARIAQVSTSVHEVLDALAVAEPLDVQTVAAVSDPEALTEAESLGLVSVDSGEGPATVRLAHPMLGEVRRTGSLRLRRLRGRIAGELARKTGTDPRELVRRAVLTIESDLTPDAELLLGAASAAAQLHDARLAQEFAARAVTAGGGVEAKITLAMTNVWLQRPGQAETILAELAGQTTGPQRSQIAVLRAVNFAGGLGDPANAERELDAVFAAGGDVSQPNAAAPRALVDLMRGRSSAAIERAGSVLPNPLADDLARMVSAWVLVTGFGDVGCVDEIQSPADAGYALAAQSSDVSHLRFQLAALQARAYRFAGALGRAGAAVARIRQTTLDVPFEESWHSLLAGMTAMDLGALSDARRWLLESLAYLGTGDSGRVIRAIGRVWLTTVTAMAGLAEDARRQFDSLEWWAQDPAARLFDPEKSIAQAWVNAAEGAVSQAISLLRTAAAEESDRPAQEVLLLQTATQFGDATTAARLQELAGVVQGPRAPAAAAHAAALAGGNGEGLLAAARGYEAFGDRVAAADAAAQAVVAYQRAGLRGAALSASVVAERLATECHGALTPALRAVAMPQPFTDRQREVIALVAQGLSNKEVADRLTMSVRSVEGHLFRASQRVGVNGRDELVALLRGV
ncbi:LuxR family transcriptional regulator [Mycolicibacterium sp. HK-90]|uniref:helix-turn-helix transcriptional regulator n=1 Tax=Mycolicibacterium sp. HK-90 TaxID=3056937 RepID=UPI00265915E1|nr:LuxR family transcriptional regulator [Mycolicibacterium sp. HK-90]WKG02743.1 LuxR C-terminal-related transcriptional regulator [Mycolicibacterium sp. HK-90]